MAAAKPNSAGYAFYENVFSSDRVEWHCRKTSVQLKALGIDPTHIGMDGVQRAALGGSRVYDVVHQGIFVVPASKPNNALFLQQLAIALEAGADLYLSEVATARHPVFFDFDGKFNLRSAAHVQLMLTIIRAAHLDLAEVSIILEALHLRQAADLQDIDTPLLHALDAHFRPENLLPGREIIRTWSWLDVFDMCLTLVDQGKPPDSVNNNLVNGHIAPVLCTFFILAVGKMVQQVVKTFWPRFEQDNPNSSQIGMIVLGNMGPDAYQETPSVDNDNPPYFKVGAHLHMRGLISTLDTDLYIRQSVLQHFQVKFGAYVLGKPAEAFWATCFDASVYTRGSTAGIRMAYNLKADLCGVCKNKHPQVQTCVPCDTVGRFSVARFYGPVAQLTGAGHLEVDPSKLQQIYHNKLYILTWTSLRVAPEVAPTTGLVLDGKPEPQNLREVRMRTLTAKVGGDPSKTRTIVKRIVKNSGVQEGELRFTHLLEAEIYFHDIMCNEKKIPPVNRQQHLDPTDPRFAAVAAFLPVFCGRAFTAQYSTMEVKTLTLIRNVMNGEPQTLYVGVKGTMPCFNRLSVTKTWPSCHANWMHSVYFEITRHGSGGVTQRCCNSNERDGSSRIHIPAGAVVSSCKIWTGEYRAITPPPMLGKTNEQVQTHRAEEYKQFVRNMFYLPEEQTHEVCLRVVADQARRLQRQYKKRRNATNLFPEVVGNHPEYATEISKVLHSGSKKPYERFQAVTQQGVDPASGFNLALVQSPEDFFETDERIEETWMAL